jgi:hypothetical protein
VRDQGESQERGGQVVGLFPVLGQPDVDLALAAGDTGRCVEPPVAQRFGFASGQVAVQEQVLGPGDQVDAGQREFQPGGIQRELSGGEPADAGVLGFSDPVFEPGMGTVSGLEMSNLASGCVSVANDR